MLRDGVSQRVAYGEHVFGEETQTSHDRARVAASRTSARLRSEGRAMVGVAYLGLELVAVHNEHVQRR